MHDGTHNNIITLGSFFAQYAPQIECCGCSNC